MKNVIKLLQIFYLFFIYSNCSQMIENGEGPISFLPALAVLKDSNPPEIVSIYPIGNSENNTEDTTINIVFNKKMNSTITEGGFSLRNQNEVLDGTFDWIDKLMTFRPKSKLDKSGKYRVDLSSLRVESEQGVNLVRDFSSIFYVNSDTNLPRITSTLPINGSRGISRDTDIVIVFSKPIDIPSFWNGISSSPDIGIDLPASRVDLNNTRFILKTRQPLNFSTNYTITLNNTIIDTSNNSLDKTYQISFTVGDDFEQPRLIGIRSDTITNFVNSENVLLTGFEKTDNLYIQFSEPVLPSTVRDSISLSPNVNYNLIDISGNSTEFQLIPLNVFEIQTNYQLRVSNSVLDLQNNSLFKNYAYNIRVNGPRSRYLWIRNIYITNALSTSINPSIINILSPADPAGGPTTYNYSTGGRGLYIEFCRGETLATCDVTSIPRDLNIILSSLINTISFDFGPVSGSPYLSFPIDITPIAADSYLFSAGIYNIASNPSTYLLRINGGKEGVNDSYGNYMNTNYQFRIRLNP